ncbi:MAG TPA: hypothetical protein VFX19_01100, partial [Dehalococcoidia bacterium]|nr:hypothetical protein [Dehalococcoidia bacterium]
MAEVTLRIRFNGTRVIVLGGLVLAIAAVRRLASRRRVFEAPLLEPDDKPPRPSLVTSLTVPSPEPVEDTAPTATSVFVIGPRPVKDATGGAKTDRRSGRRSTKVELALALVALAAYAGVLGGSVAGGGAPDLLHLRSSSPAAAPVLSDVLGVNQPSAVSAAGDAPAPYPTVDPAADA